MAAKQTPEQKKIVDRVMHEFKHHELEGADGRPVKNPRQAIAVALSEAGASNRQTPRQNSKRLKQTRAKQAKGETAMQEKEGGNAKTRSDLYEEARRRNVPGRSKMDKAELERALGR